MVDYSEEEQVERLRAWWSENGTSLLVAIGLGVVALLGWREWQSSQRQEAVAASVLFEEMLTAVEEAQMDPLSDGQAAIAQARANRLVQDYSATAYGDFARLLLARLAVEDGDSDRARELLQEVANDPASDMIRFTAQLRLARVEAEAGDASAALALLDKAYPDAFRAQALEIKGDVLRAQGDVEGARAAYSGALDAMQDEQFRELVQMKLDDLVVPAS